MLPLGIDDGPLQPNLLREDPTGAQADADDEAIWLL
jgi:hypothetical protein